MEFCWHRREPEQQEHEEKAECIYRVKTMKYDKKTSMRKYYIIKNMLALKYFYRKKSSNHLYETF